MSGVNKIILLGYISGHPEAVTNHSGIQTLSFIVTTKESHMRNGQMVEHSEDHQVTLSGALARYEFLKKEAYIYLEGSLKTSAFRDEAGIQRFSTGIIGLRCEHMARNNQRGEK